MCLGLISILGMEKVKNRLFYTVKIMQNIYGCTVLKGMVLTKTGGKPLLWLF